ncbi:MAG: hypothetical protein K8T20_13850 [Planctomycetes bacterium]|nr:hypothetical protein [Planctomycetota bacterium]
MRLNHFVLSATLLAIAATARAEDPKKDSAEPAAVTPFVKVGNLTFFRATEDAFSRARKEGKLVFVYRMLGDLDGLT